MAPGDNEPRAERSGMGFLEAIRTVEHGRFIEEVDDRLRELTAQMSRQARHQGGKPKGVLTVKLALALTDGVYEIVPDVQVKEPRRQSGRTVLFEGRDGGISRTNERQHELPLPGGHSGRDAAAGREAEDSEPARDVLPPPTREMRVLP